ncbi:MAG: translation initiation factor IF-2 [Bacteroidetes bacterium]|nr:translation initiation factor IF-2 [Bacteroidota bacterium]
MSTINKFKKVRLFQLAKQFNVSVDALVDHMRASGHKDALAGTGINASIDTEEAYEDLLDYFADDRVQAERVQKKRAARRESDGEGAEDTPAVAVVVEESKEEPAPIVVIAPAPEAVVDVPLVAEDVSVPELVEDVVSATPLEEAKIAAAPVELTVDPAHEKAELEAAKKPDSDTTDDEAVVPVVEKPKPTPAKSAAPAPKKPAPAVDEDDDLLEDSDDDDVEDGVDDDQLILSQVPEIVLSADRYKLTGTTVLGKIDLGAVEDSEPGAKRKRKRKRKKVAGTVEAEIKIKGEAKAPLVKDDSKVKGKGSKKKKGPAVDEKDVEATLQETLRELQDGASRVRQKRRRQRRDTRAEERDKAEADLQEKSSTLQVTEFLSTGELANLMDVQVTEVISSLFAAGMMVSINQRLDADTITIVADEFGFDVEFITDFTATDIEISKDKPEDLLPRTPVVTVMGHVDHGKTSLLDFIRKADVVAGEAGGITQHIGAYQVILPSGKHITFLDTPGHEAFTAMRARGALVTDVIILVVAADDAVMPQTVEAINHAQAAGVPMVVAINKIDKTGANIDRVMQQLGDKNILVEQWGGKIQCELVSAHTGQGIPELLDKVLLEAELLDLKANPNRNAVGTVIESRLEKGRGNVATVLVQNGTLKVGDPFVAGVCFGRIRAMFDERDRRVYEVGPSSPALVIGLDGSPSVGDSFIVMDDEKSAKEIASKRQQIHREQSMRQRKHITLDEIGRRLALGQFRELNIIVKGDVGGSVEALSDSLMKLGTEEVVVNIIHKGVGAINESDVVLASASDAIIIGFQVRPMLSARQMAEREEIDIRLYSVIYNAIEEVRDALEGLLSPDKSEKINGVAEVRETFKVPKLGMIAGCHVIEGKIRRPDKIHLIRDGVVIYDGTLASLKRFKDDVREVLSGYDCGIGIDGFNDLKVGDQIESYEIIETKRLLER